MLSLNTLEKNREFSEVDLLLLKALEKEEAWILKLESLNFKLNCLNDQTLSMITLKTKQTNKQQNPLISCG